MKAIRSAPAAILILALTAGGTAGQDVPRLRSHRHMAVANLAFLTGARPALHAGYLIQTSLAKSGVGVDEFGVPTVHPPRWFGHLLVSGGWSFDTDGDGDAGLAALGQLGVVRRLDEEWLTVSRLGLAAQGSVAPEGYGAVVRFGFFHGNAALSLGWMRFTELDRDRFVVSADLLRCILQDLGLVRRCVLR